MIKFNEIEFGYKSAEAERRNRPELLLEGFFERNNIVEDLLDGPTYLVLGYKGSGKSSIAEHLSLRSKTEPNLFVETALLRDFPFEQVPAIVTGDQSPSTRTNLAWSLLLLLKLFESLSGDEGAIRSNVEIDRVAKELRALNLLPKRKFRDLVLASKEVNLSVALPKIFSASLKSQYSEPVLILSQVRDALRQLVAGAATNSQHMLIVDGLDEVFTDFAGTYEVLASLVHEADALNADFDEADSAAKVVILCRTDLFERLPSPNINKLRDYSVTLDWYHSPQRPKASELFAVATHRARLAGYEGADVLSDYLPDSLHRKRGGSIRTFKFLLDHTRHTPRDFLQLLHHVQAEVHAGQLQDDDVFDGLREYSIAYFLPELKDELAGYFRPAQVEDCFRLIGGLRRREFSLGELEAYAAAAHLATDLDIREALRVLFDCSAIGNIVVRPRGGNSQPGTYFTFRFRNRNASINFTEKFVLHRGAWKALNLT